MVRLSTESPRVFALTGGIASGKSTVAAVWRAAGLPVIDADQLARQAVAPGTPALAAVVEAFGCEVIQSDGALDRARLASLVFADPERRAELNGIVHPWVQRLAEAAFQRAAQAGEALVAYEIPLLFETGQQDRYRPVVVVAADPTTQLERARARDGAERESILARIAAQVPLEEKVAGADFVIHNDGSWEQLQREALRVLDEVRRG